MARRFELHRDRLNGTAELGLTRRTFGVIVHVVCDREADEVVAGCGNDAGASGNVTMSQQECGEGGEGGDEGGEHGEGLRAVDERPAEGARPV
jgi:hypothetical protein